MSCSSPVGRVAGRGSSSPNTAESADVPPRSPPAETGDAEDKGECPPSGERGSLCSEESPNTGRGDRGRGSDMVAVPGLVRRRTIVRRVAAEKSANAGTASDEKRQQEAGSKEGAGDARARRNLLDRDGWQGERARENGKLEESEESSPPGTARALHRVPFGTVPFLGSPDRDAHGERSLARLPGQGAVAPNVHPDARYRGAPGSTRVSIETAGRRVLAPVLRGDSPLRRGSETGPEGRRRLGCFPESRKSMRTAAAAGSAGRLRKISSDCFLPGE